MDIEIKGICTQSVAWLYREGFFENPLIADTQWLVHANEDVLNLLEKAFLSFFGADITREEQLDIIEAIVFIEKLKDKKIYNFWIEVPEEEQLALIKIYSISSVLEKERRNNKYTPDSLEVPLKQIKWSKNF